MFRQWNQPQNNFRDHPQRSLGADKQILEIIAGTVLHDLAPDFDHLAVGQNDFKPAHIIARDSVFHGTHSACIRIYIAADRRSLFAGVRRVKQIVRFHEFGNLHQKHARFKSQCHIDFIQFKEMIHRAEVQHDSAVECHGCADKPRPLSARSHGNLVFMRIFHDFGNFPRRKHLDKRFGLPFDSAELVMPVILADCPLCRHALRRTDRTEKVHILLIHFPVIRTHFKFPFSALIRAASFGTIS